MPKVLVFFIVFLVCIFFSEGAVAKFVCKEEGNFADPNNESGNTYYECKLLRKGIFTRVKKTCPGESIFDAETQKCYGDDDADDLEFAEETTTAIPEFECTARGRFADLSDKTCRGYFLCNQLFNGSFVKTRYTCPMSNFDPNLHRCVLDYVCPWMTTTIVATTEEDTTGTTEEAITTTPSTTTTVVTTEETTLTTEEPTTALTTEEQTTTISTTLSNLNTVTPETTTILSVTTDWGSNSTSTTTESSCSGIDDFTCEKIGRFKNGGDCSCQWYYLCNQLRNGTFIQTPYKCPKNSIFDPSISICSLLYNCPSKEQFIIQ